MNVQKIIYRIRPVVITLMAVLCLTSCGDEHNYFPEIAIVPEGGARVKFVHAASDAAGVTVTVDGVRFNPASASSYGNAFPVTNYSQMESGTHTFLAAVPHGEDPSDELSTTTLDLKSDKYHTVFLGGTVGNYELVDFEDDFASIPFEGFAYIRFVNMVHDSDNGLTFELKTQGGIVISPFVNYSYKEGYPQFAAIEPGAYTSFVIKDATTGTVVATAANNSLTLSPNKVYTFFSTGQINWSESKYKPALRRMTHR